jgi:protein-tyrosine phosphatase
MSRSTQPCPDAVRLEGAPNFRDLGGHRTTSGAAVRRGLLYRSGNLSRLSDRDLVTLETANIRTVVDLRPDFEIDMFGRDRLPRAARWVQIPITGGGMDEATHEALRRGDLTALPDLAEANRRFIIEYTAQLGEMIRLAAEPANLPLVFHCIGGKDRTGIAAALLLSVLGVPWQSVQADYLRTNDQIRLDPDEQLALLARVTGSSSTYDTDAAREAARRFFVLESRYIDAAYDEIVARAGSLERYVERHLGIEHDVVARLRETLLDEAPRSDPPPHDPDVHPTTTETEP